MKYLIVEDERALADMLRDHFKAAGNEVDIRNEGTAGYMAAKRGGYDILILDVMLPGMDGFEIVKSLRADGIKTPVIMLTARSDIEDRLAGFESGAQDYLTKPFDIRELDARVRVLLLAAQNGAFEDSGTGNEYGPDQETAGLRYGDILLRETEHIMEHTGTGKQIRLPAKEYTLMEYFMRNSEQLLSKEQITVRIWGYTADVNYNNEEVYISFLRKKLRFIGSEAQIATVRGAGYVLKQK